MPTVAACHQAGSDFPGASEQCQRQRHSLPLARGCVPGAGSLTDVFGPDGEDREPPRAALSQRPSPGAAANLVDIETVLCQSPVSERRDFLTHVAGGLLHLSDGDHPATGRAAVIPPSPIRLHELLPARTYDLTRVHAPLDKTLDDVMQLLCPGKELGWSSVLPEGLRLHPQTAKALSACTRFRSEPCGVDSYHVYTDGSYDGSTSAWAVVCVPAAGDMQIWPLWLRGVVELDPDSSSWFGAARHGAEEAEITAVCVALLWALTLQGRTQFLLSSDSLVTVRRVQGTWNFPPTHLLAKTCRALAQAAEVLGAVPWRDIFHIPAHVGFGWNEFADVLAKQAVQKCTRAEGLPCLGSRVRDSSIEHLWLLLAAHRQPTLWPTFTDGGVCTDLAVRSHALGPDLYFGRDSRKDDCVAPRGWVRLCVVSMNVQTLEGEGIQHSEGRVGYLREQMCNAGAHLV